MEIDQGIQEKSLKNNFYCKICKKHFNSLHGLKVHNGMQHPLTKGWLEHQYITLKKSSLKIAKEKNIGKTTVLRNLEKYNIKRRTTSEALKERLPWCTGKHLSEETKKKISKAHKGIKSWCKGLTKETNSSLKSMSEKLKGRIFSKIHRKKISEKTKGRIISEETKEKLRESHKGEKCYRWKGGITKNNGYIQVKSNHCNVDVRGYIYEHRLNMEKKIGRQLWKWERIHHINGIKDDNRIENLYLCRNDSHHIKIHHQLDKLAKQFLYTNKYGKIKFDHEKGKYYIIWKENEIY